MLASNRGITGVSTKRVVPIPTKEANVNYLGIDVGRKTSAVRALNAKGSTVLKKMISNTPTELSDMLSRASAKGEGVRVFLETGNCTFIYARQIRQAGGEVYVVDAYQNALIRESLKKDDEQDAFQLADQGRRGMYPKIGVYVPTEQEEDLRRLVAHRADLVRQQSRAIQKAVRLCDRHGAYYENGKLLTKKAWLGLQCLASTWPGLDQEMLNHYCVHLALVKEQIKEVEAAMQAAVNAYAEKEAALLDTIPGFGSVTIAALLAQLGNPRRFKTGREVCGYLGLTPRKRKSGKKGGLGHISKAGNARLRGYIVNAAEAFRKYAPEDDPLRHWYEKLEARKGWYKARIALARRLVTCAFGMLKSRTEYSPQLAIRAA